MNRIRVALIDSGIDVNHHEFFGKSIKAIELVKETNKVYFKNSIFDSNGHGTAMAGIIFSKSDNIDLLSIKILDESLKCSCRDLIKAIQFAIENGVHIVNLSLGTTEVKNIDILKKLCTIARRKGIYLVSAFHNKEDVSYPAIFPEVIGVRGRMMYSKYDYIYDHNRNEAYARGSLQKILWRNNGYSYDEGNSYASAHFSGILASIMYEHSLQNWRKVKNILIKNSLDMCYIDKLMKKRLSKDWIKEAVLFPVAKENIDMVGYGEKLGYKILGFYDYRDFFFSKYECEVEKVTREFFIYNSLEEGLSKADTLMIGDISHIPPPKQIEILRNIIRSTIKLGKNIFSREPLPYEEYGDLYKLAEEKEVIIQTKYL